MTKSLSSSANQYLANVGVSYIKLHNLHWNVTGKQFKAVHEYLESLYDATADVLDEIAEILKMDDHLPLASMQEYLAIATIEELESKEICVEDTLHIVLEDLETLRTNAIELHSLAEKEEHFTLVSTLENHITNYSKNIWFIHSMLK